MNKIQYIELLKLRGITELDGKSIAKAVEETGGEPTLDEMLIVNDRAMNYFILEYEEQKNLNSILSNKIDELQKRVDWLNCLECAGVDNWNGWEYALDIYNEEYNK